MIKSTLRAYIHTDPKQRKPLGAKSGRQSVVNPEVSNFVAQVAVRAESLRAFASKMDIPESTLRAYIHTDPKQRKIGRAHD